MTITELNGQHICLLGYGLEGASMQKALAIYAPDAKITIADSNAGVTAEGAALQVGPHYLDNLDQFDVIIRSSGIPNLPELERVKSKITTMAVIFFDTIAHTGVRTIGVTGSKGKSTTTTLIYNALYANDPDHTYLMGNLYLPMIDFLHYAKPGNTFVIELSSYMLEPLRRSPNIAVVTSFFPEHLDRHGSVESYWAAKRNIAEHQTPEDTVFYNANSRECQELAEASPGHKIGFVPDDFPLDVSLTNFIGEHNRSNLAAAYKVATYVGVPDGLALRILRETEPLPHRLQSLGIHGDIEWVNDSIATAPEATLAALDALGDNVETLFLGGFDRGYNFSELMTRIAATDSIKQLIFFPATGERMKALLPEDSNKIFLETKDMDQAVQWAAAHTNPGKIALLSCASPSFGLYKDFNARGEAFIHAVKKLDHR
ncbi:MAG TPA: UDP-N-acetylmuramoyl-L-alanine--D-glutamate ligase [Candidatus Saccharimonadales bacterium]|nr:UDP-N-acetylmuramoyl-L-alanine--D-glutamate ligase [Candidatus Saccharimonadales bacterium]